MEEGLYEVAMEPVLRGDAKSVLACTSRQILWHGRLGHVSHATRKKMLSLVKGIQIGKAEEVNFTRPVRRESRQVSQDQNPIGNERKPRALNI